MKKKEKVLGDIVTLKRQQAEGVFQNLNGQLDHLQRNKAQLKESLDALFAPGTEDEVLSLLQQHQYSELLARRLKEIEAREAQLFAAIEEAMLELKQAMFSEDQVAKISRKG